MIKKDEREGLMNCYCFGKLKSNPFGMGKIDFSSFNSEDHRKWCIEWWEFFKVQASLKYIGPMVVIFINLIVPIIF